MKRSTTPAHAPETAPLVVANARHGPCGVCASRAPVDALARLDIGVNNAGNKVPEPKIEVSDGHLDALNALNMRAVVVVAQAAVRKMLQHPTRRERGGTVINLATQMGHVGSPNRTVYGMTKQAVEGPTRAMAVELAPEVSGSTASARPLSTRRGCAASSPPPRSRASAVEDPARAPGQRGRHRGRRVLPRVACGSAALSETAGRTTGSVLRIL